MKINTLPIKLRTTLLAFIALSIIVTLSVFALAQNRDASAADARNFDPGNIISDAVFYNSSAMSASQIQSFLNARVPNCDTNGTGMAVEWGRPDISRATLASYIRNGTNGYTRDTAFHAPPYVCLKNFRQDTPQMAAASGLCGGISARSNASSAQILSDIARACGINPQVLLVLLQKEQSLVTDIWPLQRQYRGATGFACPDTAPCDPKYNGFFYQVYYAARQFKIYQAYPNSYNYVPGRTNKIYWQTNLGEFINPTGNANDPSRSGRTACGYQNVYIQNQATAALYIYTPYQPNQRAMANLYGTGDGCSAYGNRNFWRMFTDWFGSTVNIGHSAIQTRHQELGGNSGKLGTATGSPRCGLIDSGCYQNFENGSILWKKSTGAWESLGSIRSHWITTGWERGTLGYPTGPEIRVTTGGWQQTFERGVIVGKGDTGYWESKGSIRQYWLSTGSTAGTLGYPTGPETQDANGTWEQAYENGVILGKRSTGYWGSRTEINNRYQGMGGVTSKLGYPIGPTRCGLVKDGCYQNYERGSILWTAETGAWESLGSIRSHWITTGWERGTLGYPTGPETQDANGTWEQAYENGVILGKRSTGYWGSRTEINNRYQGMGGVTSKLGYPIGPTRCGLVKDGCYQNYERGSILWTAETGAWESLGSIRSHWITTGWERGTLGYPTGPETQDANGTWEQAYENGVISSKKGVATITYN